MAAAMQAAQARKRPQATAPMDEGTRRRSTVTRDGDKFIIPDAFLDDHPALKAFIHKHVSGLEYNIVLDAWVI